MEFLINYSFQLRILYKSQYYKKENKNLKHDQGLKLSKLLINNNKCRYII